MTARVVMVQGTASSVGKSLVSAALCRAFARRGYSVAPFKAQNMSNNAAVVPGSGGSTGGEIGRAQALQAAAARVEPSVDMNPVLLKPEADSRSQVILSGSPIGSFSAREYYAMRPRLWAEATAALDRLRASHDLVVIEGAGSPAEINLRDSDMVNMAVARHANSPVILVGDIDPGGVFAQFLGTLELLEPAERALVKGLVVNKFRGDLSLLEPGLRMIESRTGVPVLGVLPWMRLSALAEEDAQPIERASARGAPRDQSNYDIIDIAVIRYPRLANFDDVDALALDHGVRLRFVEGPGELGAPDAVILPGSKATIADLAWLRERGLDEGIRWLARAGKSVVGLCGGYQMLGLEIEDGEGVEGRPGSFPGLGLLPVRTVFAAGKRVTRVRATISGGPGFFAAAKGLEVEGYEIHSGSSTLEAGRRGSGAAAAPFSLRGEGAGEGGKPEGAATLDGRVWGSYIHGVFDLPGFRRAWLSSIGHGALRDADSSGQSLSAARDEALDALANAAEDYLDMRAIAAMAELDMRDWKE